MGATAAIIQARTGSTRLPRKVLASVLGRPLLDLMLERVKRASTLDQIVVATTTAEQDDAIAEVSRSQGVVVFRGSADDVLGRYVGAASTVSADVVVRLTADCPLIDPDVIDHMVRAHKTRGSDVDLVTNTPPRGRSYPDGMDVEVFTTGALARLDASTADTQDREHVTRAFHRTPFRAEVIDINPPMGEVRITVDNAEDLERARAIFEDLYPTNPSFGLSEILAWLTQQANAV